MTKTGTTPEYDTHSAKSLGLQTTTIMEASDETTETARNSWTPHEFSATESTITTSRTLPDDVTSPPSSTEQQDKQSTTRVKYPDIVRPPPLNVCSTLSCKRSASHMISMIDHGADPCEDFYQYSCGGSDYNHINSKSPEEQVLETLPGQFRILQLELEYY